MCRALEAHDGAFGEGLVADDAAGEEDAEKGVLSSVEEVLEFKGIGERLGLDERVGLLAVPDEDHVLEDAGGCLLALGEEEALKVALGGGDWASEASRSEVRVALHDAPHLVGEVGELVVL